VDVGAAREAGALLQAQATLLARRSSLESDLAAWNRTAAEAVARHAELAARDAGLTQALADREAAPGLDPAAAAQARDAEATAAQRYRDAESEAAQARKAQTQAASAARDAEQAATAAREELIRCEGALARTREAWGAVAELVLERLGAGTVLPEPDDVSDQAIERGRRSLDRLVRERDAMGPVNLRADLEQAELETALATLENERDEIGTAIARLRGSIGALNREGRERLQASFAEIDGHFQQLFTRMFGGGRAHLSLTGSDNPLEAGLEIYAQPPGKKLSALSLLSGGEQALTALSLIFAVFRCNPAPVCVLDEVDAPLDDANVERFCALLADMVRETGTRFLVVTHHQLTMARMDRLYGVTMQERGVSRLLSVDLGTAVGFVETQRDQSATSQALSNLDTPVTHG
jgi:chromosome segregation protein